MKPTPAQKSELRLQIVLWVIIALLVSVCFCYQKYNKVFFYDKVTGTKYVDCGKFNQVVFSSGEVLAFGNEKSEYENNEIGE
jgi:hypothetical protein